MKLLTTRVEKAQSRLAGIRTELSAARAGLQSGLDFDEAFAVRENVALLERKELAAVDALANAEDAQAKEAAEATKSAALAQIDVYRREAERVVPSRLNKIDKLARSLAVEMNWLADHRHRVDEMNRLAREFGLPGVTDGESLHRKMPDRTEPAQFETREVWRDAAGNEPSQYRQHPETGEIVPVGGGTKRLEKVQIRAERFVPGQISGGRLCDGIRLMSVAGERLFPKP